MAKYVETRSLPYMLGELLEEVGSKRSAASLFGTTVVTSLYCCDLITNTDIRISELKSIYDSLEVVQHDIIDTSVKDVQIAHNIGIGRLLKEPASEYSSPLLRKIISSVDKGSGLLENELTSRSLQLLHEVSGRMYGTSQQNALADHYLIERHLGGRK